MSNSIRVIRKLPDAPAPTRAAYKKPVLYNNSKHMRVVEPCQYQKKPIRVPKKTKKCEALKKPRFWTPEKYEELIRLYRDGKTYDEIGEYFGKCKSVVYGEVQKLIDEGKLEHRAPVNSWSDDDLALMRKMRLEGKTYGEIGDKVGRRAKTCHQQYRRIYGKNN